MGAVTVVVVDVVEDKDAANNLKFQIQKQLSETKFTELEAQAKIVLTELQGFWLQRSWRPLLMVAVTALVVAHWLGSTAPDIAESVQNGPLNIVMIGVGGYVMGRSAEKVADKWKEARLWIYRTADPALGHAQIIFTFR